MGKKLKGINENYNYLDLFIYLIKSVTFDMDMKSFSAATI